MQHVKPASFLRGSKVARLPRTEATARGIRWILVKTLGLMNLVHCFLRSHKLKRSLDPLMNFLWFLETGAMRTCFTGSPNFPCAFVRRSRSRSRRPRRVVCNLPLCTGWVERCEETATLTITMEDILDRFETWQESEWKIEHQSCFGLGIFGGLRLETQVFMRLAWVDCFFLVVVGGLPPTTRKASSSPKKKARSLFGFVFASSVLLETV